MKKSLFIFVVAWLTVGISACGTVDDLAPDDVETLGQSSHDLFEETELALSVPDVVRYECICDLSAHTCGPRYPFPLVKSSSCRYKRSANTCRGKCEGHCAKQGGGIERGSEFKGKCKKRLIPPNGTSTHYEEECDDADLEASFFEG